MNLTVTAFYDERFGYWRARFRGPHYDKKVRIPKAVFEETGVPPDRNSKQGETIALNWAMAEKRRLEDRKADAPRSVMPLDDIFRLFQRRNPEGVKPITQLKHRQVFAHLLDFATFRTLSPAEIDNGAALDYVAFRKGEHAQPRTIMNELRLLGQLLHAAYEWQRETGVTALRLTKLPVKAVGQSQQKGRALSVEDFFAILNVDLPKVRHRDRMRRVLIVGVTTMLRRENLTGLRWAWVDKKNRWLTIPAAHMKGRVSEQHTLSVPLCEWALEAIGSRKHVSEFVFADRPGGRAWRFDKMFATIAKQAGIPRFTMHDLRRTGATWLAQSGVEERIIGALLGHSTRETQHGQFLVHGDSVTRSKYLFVTAEELRAASDVFDVIRVRGNFPEIPAKSRSNSGSADNATA